MASFIPKLPGIPGFGGGTNNMKLAFNTVLFSSAVIAISYLIYKYKVPVLCYGCDDFTGISADIFSCVVDSSEGSKLCEITRTVEKVFSDAAEKISSLSKAVYLELTKHIPEEIQAALMKMISTIQDLANNVYKAMKQLVIDAKDFIVKTFTAIKDFIVDTAVAFFNMIIKPILDFIYDRIIQPFIEAIKTVQDLAKQVADTIDGFLSKIGEEFNKFGKEIARIFKFIPDKIAWLLDQAIDGINIMICGSKVLVDKIVKPIIDGVNVFSDGVKIPRWELSKELNLGVFKIPGIAIPAIQLIPGYEKVKGIPWKAGSGLENIIHDFGDCPANKEALRGNLLPNITGGFPNIFEPLIKMVTDIFNGIKEAMIKVWEAFITPIKIILDAILGLLKGIINAITDLIKTMWAQFEAILKKIKDTIIDVGKFIGKIIYDNIIKPVLDALEFIFNGIVSGIKAAIKGLSDTIDFLIKGISDLFNKLADKIKEVANYVGKNLFYVIYFYYAKQCDWLVPFKISKTVKIQIVSFVLIIAALVYSQALQFVRMFFNNIQYLIMFCGLIYVLIYAMPAKKEDTGKSIEIMEMMRNEKTEMINDNKETMKNEYNDTIKWDPVENIIINTKVDTKTYPLSKMDKDNLVSKLKDKYILYKIEKYTNIKEDINKQNLIKTLKNKYIEHYQNEIEKPVLIY